MNSTSSLWLVCGEPVFTEWIWSGAGKRGFTSSSRSCPLGQVLVEDIGQAGGKQ